MKLFRKEEGFTLVELMVVVLIIGILVAIAIPVFNAAKANAQQKSCFSNQRTIEGSAQTYSAENNGVLPTGIAQLVPTYIKETPKCPGPNGTGEYTGIDSSGTVTLSTNSDAHAHF